MTRYVKLVEKAYFGVSTAIATPGRDMTGDARFDNDGINSNYFLFLQARNL
jgi:hypothetical protein